MRNSFCQCKFGSALICSASLIPSSSIRFELPTRVSVLKLKYRFFFIKSMHDLGKLAGFSRVRGMKGKHHAHHIATVVATS